MRGYGSCGAQGVITRTRGQPHVAIVHLGATLHATAGGGRSRLVLAFVPTLATVGTRATRTSNTQDSCMHARRAKPTIGIGYMFREVVRSNAIHLMCCYNADETALRSNRYMLLAEIAQVVE